MKTNVILTALFILLAPFFAEGQKQEADTTYRSPFYKFLVGLYDAYPKSPDDIIFLGNSITYGVNWNEMLGMCNVRNRGIPGDTSFGILERLDQTIDGRPAKVFILAGINDISFSFPPDLILRNFKRIVSRLKAESPETRIYIQTILPVNNTFSTFVNHFNKDDMIAAVNEGLKDLAETESLTLIDIHPYFLDKDKRLDTKYTDEGLHLNAEGYRVWARILQKYVK